MDRPVAARLRLAVHLGDLRIRRLSTLEKERTMNLKDRALDAHRKRTEERNMEDERRADEQRAEKEERLRRWCRNGFGMEAESVDGDGNSFMVDGLTIISGANGFHVALPPCQECGYPRLSFDFNIYVGNNAGEETTNRNLASLGKALCGEALYHSCPPPTEEAPAPPRPLPKTVEYRVDSIEQRLLECLGDFVEEQILAREGN
jgi:hypothetical protein